MAPLFSPPRAPGANAQAIFRAGLAHHQAGRLQEAEAHYRNVLALDAKHFDAMHLLGVVALQTGRLDDAKTQIQRALEIDPRSAAALNNLGNVFLRQNQLQQALEHFSAAAKLQPALVDAQLNLGVVLRRLGRRNDAADHLRRAVALNPRALNAQANLGAVLLEVGDPDGAVQAFRTVASALPEDADAQGNLGGALMAAGKIDDALAVLERAARLRPDSASIQTNRGLALARLSRYAEARQCLERAAALEPRSAAAHANLGMLLREMRSSKDAIPILERALALDPESHPARLALAQAAHDAGDDARARTELQRLRQQDPDSIEALLFDATLCLECDDRLGAETALLAALARAPRNAEVLYRLGNVLMLRGRSREALDRYRSAVAADAAHVQARWAATMALIQPVPDSVADAEAGRGSFAGALEDVDRWFRERGDAGGELAVGSTQPFYLAYQPQDNRELLSRYGVVCARLMDRWHATSGGPRGVAAPSPLPIRIGIASAHIHDHSVWNALVKGWLDNLDKRGFEVVLFNLGQRVDAETRAAARRASRLEHGRRDLKGWVRCIGDARLDVLIYPEIGMDATTVRLASLRLARVQVASWGHPQTTGLPTIDHFLSADGLEPVQAERHYSEKLVRLPNLGVCYTPAPVSARTPALDRLGLPADRPLLLCPGMPFKYAPVYDGIWVEIARQLPDARLVFFQPRDSELSAALAERLRGRFRSSGVDFDRHVSFVPFLGRDEFFGLMRIATLFLDSPGFSGFNTVMQAIECGLPVVSLEGEFLRGRLGSGILRRMGAGELVATSPEAYIELATALVDEATRRADAQRLIASRRSKLFGDLQPVEALDEFLRGAARR